ncbi:MAG: hypothetical protein ACOH2M_28260 [Cypionkella sp.]
MSQIDTSAGAAATEVIAWPAHQDCKTECWFAPTLRALSAERHALGAELDMMKTAGIIEVAVRNPSVADFMQHWDGRTEKAERDAHAATISEITRRRDEWKAKCEGYEVIRLALREKVGAPWPPNMSRVLWAGIAADEKKRADDAEATIADMSARLSAALERAEAAEAALAEVRT